MGRLQKITIILIIVLAFFARAVWLERAMPALNWDEVAHGYNSYSILKTGRDEYGNLLPINLRSFDDYKPPLYAYISVPFIKYFGLNAYGVRSVSVVSGLLVVIFSGLLAKLFFKKNNVALLTAFLISIEPWGILFSRAAYEANLALALTLAGLYFSIKSKLKGKAGIAGVVLIGLSMYSYQVNKLLAPLIIGILIYNFWIGKKKKDHKSIKLLALIFATIASPIFLNILVNINTLSRLGSTSIFSKYELLDLLSQIPARYLSYLSPINLFVRSSPEPTQQIPGYGMFYAWEFVFLLAGLIYIFKNVEKYKLFILILFASILPAAITWNWFYPARVLIVFAFFSMVISVGITKIVKNNILITVIIIAISIVTFSRYMHTLFFIVPFNEVGSWQGGMKEMLQMVDKYEDDYSTVIIETSTAQPHIFTLFYTKYDPAQYHLDIKQQGGIPIPRKNFDFGKFVFRPVLYRDDKFLKDTLLASPISSLSEEKVKAEEVEVYETFYDRFENPIGKVVGIKERE